MHRATRVDVLHRLNGVPVDTSMISGAETSMLAIGSVCRRPTCHREVELAQGASLRSRCVLPGVRAVREQVNWAVSVAPADHDFASAFLFLADHLGLTA